MGLLANLRETWRKDRAWGKSVPQVPETHVEPPMRGAQRFTGNHGAWMAPLAMVALLFCLLATLSTPIYEPMTVIELAIKGDIPGGSGAAQTLKVGLWGFCLSGPHGDCSKLRGLFSSFSKVSGELPGYLQPLAPAFANIPQSFLNAVGVFPIFVNAYIYAGAIYAAWSSTFFERKERRTVRWQEAAIACFHWVIIWISIAFGLMIGLYKKIKANIAQTELKDFISCKIGVSAWLLLTALILTLWIAINWQIWRFNAKRGIWQPAAWMMYIGDSPADVEQSQTSSLATVANAPAASCITTKEEEVQAERADDKKSEDGGSESGQKYDLPCYMATASAEETVVNAQEPAAKGNADLEQVPNPSPSTLPKADQQPAPTAASHAS